MALADGTPRIVTACALALLVVALYWPARDHGWLHYDDDLYVTSVPAVAEGLTTESLTWAWTSREHSNWFPLTRLSWLVDAEIHGLAARGFHTTNLLLHALATAVLYLALSRLTGARWRSAFAAGVFGLHPFAVEPVAWIAGRKDPLAGLFFALALWAYAAVDGRLRGVLRSAPVFALLFCGLLSKPTLVTFPFVLLLLDTWPLGRLRRADRWQKEAVRGAVREKLPLFALVIAFSLITLFTQSSSGVVADLSRLPLHERLANALVALCDYLRGAVWPRHLAVFYPHPGASLSGARIAIAALLVGGVAAIAVLARRRAPALPMGLLWFAGMLVPMLGLVQVGDQARADRYMYLPIIGLAVALTWGVPELVGRRLSPALRRIALVVVGVSLLGGLAYSSSRQLRHWHSTETLMQHALDATGDNYIAHAYLGVARYTAGDAAGAVRHWRRSAEIEPGYATVANNLAWLLATHPDAEFRSPDDALVFAERAVAITGGSAATRDTLAVAHGAAGNFARAEREARAARDAAHAAGDDALAEAIEARRQRFALGQAWQERPPSRP